MTARSSDDGTSIATVTTLVRIGDEPIAIARSTLALARKMGPTMIVSLDDDLAATLAAEADEVHVADTIEAAILAAARAATTDAILLVGGRAIPRMPACRSAASLLTGEVGWVIGGTRPFNRDRYASDRREVLGAELRRRAAPTGLALWEADATLVRTDLLALHQIECDRPWGDWLRQRGADGFRGARIDADLSLRAAPVAASSFWPDALARQHASAADLARAMTTGPASARLAALGLLARDLYAYPLLVWLCAPLLLGDSFPFSVGPVVAVAGLAVTALARWASIRIGLRVGLRPRADVASALYHAPGSIAALGGAVGRRLRTWVPRFPARPLVWAALLLTLVAGLGLLGHRPGETASRAAVAASLAMLGLLWAFAIRSLAERTWTRSDYRIRMQLDARLDGVPGRTVDGSPGGVALRGRFERASTAPGTEVTVEVTLDDGEVVGAAGVIADRRRRSGDLVLGVELHPGPGMLDAWGSQLLRSAECETAHVRPAVDHRRPPSGRNRWVAALDRIALGAIIAVSVIVLTALVAVLLGFRPLVVRSGSMVPTYGVGDVVFIDQIRASELRRGDVVSLEYFPEIGEGLTHRVRSIDEVDGLLEIETRGDANDTSEEWTVGPDQLVGKVVASVPWIGTPATIARNALVPLSVVVGLIGGAVALVLVVRHRLAGRRSATGRVDHPSAGSTAGATSGADGSAQGDQGDLTTGPRSSAER